MLEGNLRKGVKYCLGSGSETSWQKRGGMKLIDSVDRVQIGFELVGER